MADQHQVAGSVVLSGTEIAGTDQVMALTTAAHWLQAEPAALSIASRLMTNTSCVRITPSWVT